MKASARGRQRAARRRPWVSMGVVPVGVGQRCDALPAPRDACCKFIREDPPPRWCDLLPQRQRSTAAAQCQRARRIAIKPYPASMKVGHPLVTTVNGFDVDRTALDTNPLPVVRMARIHQSGDEERGHLSSAEEHHERIAGEPVTRADDGCDQGERTEIPKEGSRPHGAVARELPGDRLRGRRCFLRPDGWSGWQSRHRHEPLSWMLGQWQLLCPATRMQDVKSKCTAPTRLHSAAYMPRNRSGHGVALSWSAHVFIQPRTGTLHG
jgi:hypothetical protein